MKIENEAERRRSANNEKKAIFFFASPTAEQTSFLVYKRVVYKEVATLLK